MTLVVTTTMAMGAAEDVSARIRHQTTGVVARAMSPMTSNATRNSFSIAIDTNLDAGIYDVTITGTRAGTPRTITTTFRVVLPPPVI